MEGFKEEAEMANEPEPEIFGGGWRLVGIRWEERIDQGSTAVWGHGGARRGRITDGVITEALEELSNG